MIENKKTFLRLAQQLLIVNCSLFITLAAHAAIDADSARTITAPKIEYNVKSQSIKTVGQTQISNAAGQRMTLTDSYISKTGADAHGGDIEMWLGSNVHMTAKSVNRKDNDTYANDATVTACYGCDEFGNAWEVSMTEMSHDMSEKMMSFWNPVLWIYGAPVMWLPYMTWPDPTVRHKSGLLIPDFNSTNNMGTQFNLPVYLAFSDTHDATVTLSYLTAENPLFQVEHRLNAPHSQFRTSGSFTHNKAGENRWHIFNDDVIELGENARATVFLERASDRTYLQKYGFYEDQPYLDSGGSIELFGKQGYVVGDMHIFQELRQSTGNWTAPGGDILPNIRGTYQSAPIFAETYATLGADILGISGDGTASQRLIGDTRITSPWTLWGGNRVTASLSLRYDIYNFSDTLMTDGQTYTGLKNRFLPSGYVDWALPLMRGGDDWTYIIEPRARLTAMRELGTAAYAENNDSAGALLSDATLFSSNRFSGLDMWENGTFADYGVRAAAFDKDGRNVEIFVGQSYDFTDRIETDPNSGFHNGGSDYVGRVGYDNSKWFGIAGRFRFAQDDMQLRHIETTARIGTANNYVHFGHIWAAQYIDAVTMDRDINELDAGFGVKLTDRWGIRWDGIYNVTDVKFQRHTGGVYYDHPCFYLSLTYRRDNAIKEDYVGTTTFQFRFGMNINGVKQKI